MKQLYFLLGLLPSMALQAQTTSTFESLGFSSGNYWDGSDLSGGFANGNAYFPNAYDTTYFYWSDGWAYSSVQDSSTSGYGNLYAAKALTGYNGSSVYALGKQGSRIRLTGPAAGGIVNGVYVTNTTYAYNSMRDGDAFAKKFGGASGNDPDFFRLTVRGYSGGVLGTDSVDFYLADYRFSNNAQDYLVNAWTWVDLTSLGNADSLEFTLASSDNGMYGMNTPGFFAIDEFTTADSPLSVQPAAASSLFSVFPNPAHDLLNIRTQAVSSVQLRLLDMSGRVVKSLLSETATTQLSVSDLPAGFYLLEMQSGQNVQRLRVSKN